MANDLKLQESHPIDENLRPVKVGGETTGLELSKDKVRANTLESNSIESNSIEANEITTNSIKAFGAVGFDLVQQYATTVVDFKTGNKQMVTFGAGSITTLEFHFPATSGNFVCLFKQDGTGSRTITNYKAFDSAGNAALGSAATLFAGGSNPTLTTDANHVDIISIFWDADNEIAYAVPSLDFQF